MDSGIAGSRALLLFLFFLPYLFLLGFILRLVFSGLSLLDTSNSTHSFLTISSESHMKNITLCYSAALSTLIKVPSYVCLNHMSPMEETVCLGRRCHHLANFSDSVGGRKRPMIDVHPNHKEWSRLFSYG